MTSKSMFKVPSGGGLAALEQLKKGKGPLDLTKKATKNAIGSKDEKAPHEIAEVDMSVLSEVKTQQLYQWYCEIQVKLNKVQEENKKIEHDIVRRHERYIMREGDYRK